LTNLKYFSKLVIVLKKYFRNFKIIEMFFEQSEIIDLLKCEVCSQPYGEYYPPRLLPCCDKTICYNCVQTIEIQSKNNQYTCIACKKEEKMPNKGFGVNNIVSKLITRRPKEISRGQEAEKLKQNLCELEKFVNKLIFEMENGEHLITENCNELRRKVQLAKEEKIEEINKLCDSLFLKIETYEEKCKCNYKEMNELIKQKANELIKSVNESIQQQNAYLRQLAIDDKNTMECNQKMDELKKQIEKERKNIKKSMFGNQIMKFEANITLLNEEILGTLYDHTLDFTVIISEYFFTLNFDNLILQIRKYSSVLVKQSSYMIWIPSNV